MDQLTAVNMCLEADGLSPVASLAAEGDPQVNRALAVVSRVSEQVQSIGWSVNTDFKITLAIDLHGKIWLPGNALNASAKSYSTIRRVSIHKDDTGAKFLYNVFDRTDVFKTPLKVDLIYSLDFDDLTPELQHYIAARAARVFQAKTFAAATLDKFASREELEALTILEIAESEADASNILDDSRFCAQIARRNDVFFG